MDWEDIRHFIAVARAGTMSGAARSLQVDHATVSRRLAALEADLNVRLVERLPRACRLTDVGRLVLERAIDMEGAADRISRIAQAAHAPLVGKVTLSAPPVLAAHLLAHHLAEFRDSFPEIRWSLAAQAQQVSLSRREADVAPSHSPAGSRQRDPEDRHDAFRSLRAPRLCRPRRPRPLAVHHL